MGKFHIFQIIISKIFKVKIKMYHSMSILLPFYEVSLCIIHVPAHNYCWLSTSKVGFLQEGDLEGNTEVGRRHSCTGNRTAPFEFCAVCMLTLQANNQIWLSTSWGL